MSKTLQALLLLLPTAYLACNAKVQPPTPPKAPPAQLHPDSIYIDGRPVHNDTARLRSIFPDLKFYKSPIEEDIGYPDYAITAVVGGPAIVFLEADNQIWLYEIDLEEEQHTVTVAGSTYEIGNGIEHFMAQHSNFDTTAWMPAQRKALAEKEYDKI